MTQKKVKSTIIREDTSPYRKPAENLPGPGKYEKNIPFGSDIKTNVTFGSKYGFKPK